jgi:hypothetical protein
MLTTHQPIRGNATAASRGNIGVKIARNTSRKFAPKLRKSVQEKLLVTAKLPKPGTLLHSTARNDSQHFQQTYNLNTHI